MKVVISSDWHGDWTTAGVSRFNEIEAAVEHTVDEAISLRAGLYVFGGDLAETEGPGMLRTLELAVRSAAKLWQHHIRSIWLTGNHDVIEDGLCTSTLNPLRDVPGALLADEPLIEPLAFRGVDGCVRRVACLPFTPRTHNYDPRRFVEEQAAGPGAAPDLVVGHLMLEGIAVGSETKDMARGRDVFWPLAEIKQHWPRAVCVAGHYHDAQVYQGVHIVGSLARLTRSEVNNKPSYIVADI